MSRSEADSEPSTGIGGRIHRSSGSDQRSATVGARQTSSDRDGQPSNRIRAPHTSSDRADQASVWLRRLYTSPDGRDLVAMDSRRRYFSGHLRRMLVLRDDVCSTPWCDAPIAHADHTTPARDDGRTSFTTGSGKCARCNYGKEAPGWITVTGAASGSGSAGARPRLVLTTPLRRRYVSEPPPVLGWGWTSPTEPHPEGASLRPDPPRHQVPESEPEEGTPLSDPSRPGRADAARSW